MESLIQVWIYTEMGSDKLFSPRVSAGDLPPLFWAPQPTKSGVGDHAGGNFMERWLLNAHIYPGDKAYSLSLICFLGGANRAASPWLANFQADHDPLLQLAWGPFWGLTGWGHPSPKSLPLVRSWMEKALSHNATWLTRISGLPETAGLKSWKLFLQFCLDNASGTSLVKPVTTTVFKSSLLMPLQTAHGRAVPQVLMLALQFCVCFKCPPKRKRGCRKCQNAMDWQ